MLWKNMVFQHVKEMFTKTAIFRKWHIFTKIHIYKYTHTHTHTHTHTTYFALSLTLLMRQSQIIFSHVLSNKSQLPWAKRKSRFMNAQFMMKISLWKDINFRESMLWRIKYFSSYQGEVTLLINIQNCPFSLKQRQTKKGFYWTIIYAWTSFITWKTRAILICKHLVCSFP